MSMWRQTAGWAAIALLSGFPLASRAQTAAASPTSGSAEQTGDQEESKASGFLGGVRFRFGTHPGIRAGEWLRVDFHLKFQHDFRSFDPEISGDEGETSNLRKFRVGITGYVTRDLEYEVEREIRNEIGAGLGLRTRETHALWRDVFGNWRHFRRIQIRAGQFKIPFGLDQQSGSTTGDFVYRSLIGAFLSPGRDIGAMLHGRLFDRRLQYQAGMFIHDGWRAHLQEHDHSGERTIAARLVAPPLAFVTVPRFLGIFRNIEFGGAFTETPVTEGLRSLRGRTWVDTHNYFPRINVRGHRLRTGAEMSWTPGPFSVKGEVIRVRDERLGQGLRGQDLPDLISRGWYLSSTWLVTGEKKEKHVLPRRNFITGRGIGAVELAGRYEQIRFGSSEHPGLPSRSSRAANIYSTSERVATFGVNWYVNRFVRIQFNALREVIEDVRNAPISGIDTYWSRFVRVQFVL
jgi:phosphate-selective porin